METNECSVFDFDMYSVEKCVGDGQYHFDEVKDCLDNEPVVHADCSYYTYNTTGIDSYDDESFKEIRQIFHAVFGNVVKIWNREIMH